MSTSDGKILSNSTVNGYLFFKLEKNQAAKERNWFRLEYAMSKIYFPCYRKDSYIVEYPPPIESFFPSSQFVLIGVLNIY